MFYGLERQDDIYKVQYLLINIQSANIGKCKQVFFKTNVGNEACTFAKQFHLSNIYYIDEIVEGKPVQNATCCAHKCPLLTSS